MILAIGATVGSAEGVPTPRCVKSNLQFTLSFRTSMSFEDLLQIYQQRFITRKNTRCAKCNRRHSCWAERVLASAR